MSSTPGDASRRLRLSDPRQAVKSEGRRSLAFPLQSGSSYSTWLQPDNSIRCLFSCPRAWLQNPKSPSTPSGLGSPGCKRGPDKAVDHIRKRGWKGGSLRFSIIKRHTENMGSHPFSFFFLFLGGGVNLLIRKLRPASILLKHATCNSS